MIVARMFCVLFDFSPSFYFQFAYYFRHDLDLIRWTIGKDPIKVYAVGVTHDPQIKAIDDYDSVDISLIFPDNVLGSVDVTRKAVYGYGMKYSHLFPSLFIFTNSSMFRSTT